MGRSGAFWYNNSDHSIRFALETGQPFAVVREIGGQYLKRNFALQLGIGCAVNFAHAAGAKLSYNAIGRK